ncbi:MAG TPA: DUF4340 domain-containing protein [Thermoanaerobaculia bacterium]|nr:DUF4340 domain-containing protein [Thermoanaerobaculia bacterium]HUM29885.1 DUF4340 domain-containing protein [Thermoanaerobaculia bacterium]HXK68248.1 DUF4340 domain-containing protein [Thermoanaerobaculia bacterium]
MRIRTLLILGFLTVALFLFIMLYESKTQTTDERREAEKKVFTLDVESITGLEVTRGTGSYALEKKDGEWRITTPIEAPADPSAVQGILSSLQNLSKKRDLPDAADSDYGLENPALSLKIRMGDRSLVVDVGARIPASINYAIKIQDQKGVTIVPNSLYLALEKSVNDFRRRTVFAFDAARVAGLNVKRKNDVLRFEKKNSAWYLKAPFEDRAARTKVNDLIYAILGLKAEEFIDAPDESRLHELGLDSPRYQIDMVNEDGSPVVSFSVDRAREDLNQRFCILYGRNAYYCNDKVWETFAADAKDFVDPKLLVFERWSLTGMTFHSPEETLALSKDPETYTWMIKGKPIEPQNSVDSIVDALAGLEDGGRAGEDAGREMASTLILDWNGGSTSVSRVKADGRSDAVLMKVDDRPGLRKVNRSDWKGIEDSLRGLKMSEASSESPPK